MSKLFFISICVFTYLSANIVGATKGQFSINQGTASYNLEIVTPKGVSGLKPSLSINYNSSNNFNGLLGVGFSLSGLSQVSKCSQSLFDEKKDSSRNYNYCIDGQKLVLPNSSLDYGSNNEEYKTEIDSYSKIIKNSGGWTVYTKDGLIYNYGYTSDSKDSDIFYRVNKIKDRYNNEITFKYDDKTKALKQITYANNLIDFIYENKTNKKIMYSKGVKVELSKRLKRISLKINSIETSSYNFDYDYIDNKSTLKSITEVIDDNTLEPIYFTWKNDYPSSFSAKKTFNITGEKYITKTSGENIQKMFLDMNGDGFIDRLKVIGSTLYVALNKNGIFNDFIAWEDEEKTFNNNIKYVNSNKVHYNLIDMNADGLPDKVFSISEIYGYFGQMEDISWRPIDAGLYISLNTGNSFQKAKHWLSSDSSDTSRRCTEWECPTTYSSPLKKFIDKNTSMDLFDINGDGLIDRINTLSTYSYTGEKIYKLQITLATKSGDKDFKSEYVSDFSSNYKYITEKDTNSNVSQQFIDMNGDGLVDRVINYNHLTSKKGLHVALNTGSGFSEFNLWDERAESEQSFYIIKRDSSGIHSQLVDINSDGLPDRVQYKDYKTGEKGLWVSLNTGIGFADFEDWLPTVTYSNEKDYYLSKEKDGMIYKSFIDINSDGLIDIVEGNNVYFNNGSGFENKIKYFNSEKDYITKSDSNGTLVSLLDLNGDGFLEKIESNTSFESNGFSSNITSHSKTFVSSITNHKDENIEINYSTLRDSTTYTSEKDLDYPNQEIKSSPMRVVKSFTTINGIEGTNKTSFNYKNLGVNYERGSLGFEEVTETSETTNTKSITTYNQEFPYTGSIKINKIYVNNILISDTVPEYNYILKEKYYQVYLKKNTKKNYDYNSNNNTPLTTKITINSDIDNFGNIGLIRTTTQGNGDTFKKTVSNEYSNYTSNWILSRLDDSSVKHEAPEQDPITRTSKFEYDAATGTLNKEIIEPATTKSLTKSYIYDSKGNKKSETISGTNITPRTTAFQYDSSGKNQTKITNLLGHSETRIYNNKDQLKSVTGPNGFTTTFEYDEMSRKVKETKADGNYTTWEYSWTEDGHKVTQKLNEKYPITVFYDKLGRKIKTEKIGFDSKKIIEEIKYNNKGNKTKVSTPYFEDEEPEYINYIYDDINRLIEVESPGAHNTRVVDTIEYSDYSTTKTNAKGQTKTTTINVIEKVISIDDGSTINYTYDAIGNLVKTIDANNNIINIKYDNFGNKTEQNDPDMGKWTYYYNALKQLTSQTNAKGQTTIFAYDKLGRVKTKTTPEGVIEFKYDLGNKALGKVVEEKGIGVNKKYQYDNLGRLNKTISVIDNIEYVQQYTYDALGRLKKTIQPNNVEIKNNYNINGYLESVTTPRKNAGNVDIDRFKAEIAYDMQEYLKNKRLAVEYRAKINKYKLDVIRYTNIIELYKNNPTKADTINELKNHVNELNDLIYTLEGIVQNYNTTTNSLNESNLQQWLNASQSAELSNLYTTFKNDLLDIALYSVSLLEELKEQKTKSLKLLYCGNIDGIVIFCPDNMAHDSVNYTKEDNLLFYGTSSEIVTFYEKSLADLTKDVNYIKDLSKKAEYYDELSNAYNNTSSAYTEILESDDIYFYKVLKQNSLGITTSYLSGNGLITKAEYDKRGIVYNITTGYDSDSDDIRNLSFQYDSLNNVTNRVDSKLQVEQNYIYDSLNRLKYTNIDTKGTSSVLAYDYDELGNMIYKSDMGYYEYNSSRPHAVTKIGDKDFIYDANGNMTKNHDKTIKYTSFNKPSNIKTPTAEVSFYYDANNTRYKKTSGYNTVHYIGKSYEKNFYSNGTSEDKYFIYANGKLVSIFSNIDDQYKINFLHYDNLGSIDTITNNLGEVIERRSYKPFGKQLDLDKYGNEIQTVSNITNRGYTGHEHIEEVDLIHMNGRVYDANIARFLSADPHIQDSKDSQSYNRYTYVKNNPLKYTDPSGFFFKKLWKKIKKWIKPILAIVATVLIAVYAPYLLFGKEIGFAAMTTLNLGQAMIIGAISGAVTGAIMTGSLSGALKGAVFGAISAGVAHGIGHAKIFESIRGITGGKAILHGISRAAITKAQGGRWSSGFWSGFASSVLAPISKSFESYPAKVISSAIIGGAVSEISGGKFANGAVTGAFIMMFNDLIVDEKLEKEYLKVLMDKKGEKMITGLENSKDTYYIKAPLWGKKAHYDPKYKTIILTPGVKAEIYTTEGMKVLSSDQSLFHEIAHAYEHMIGGPYRDEMYIINNYENGYTGYKRVNHNGRLF